MSKRHKIKAVPGHKAPKRTFRSLYSDICHINTFTSAECDLNMCSVSKHLHKNIPECEGCIAIIKYPWPENDDTDVVLNFNSIRGYNVSDLRDAFIEKQNNYTQNILAEEKQQHPENQEQDVAQLKTSDGTLLFKFWDTNLSIFTKRVNDDELFRQYTNRVCMASNGWDDDVHDLNEERSSYQLLRIPTESIFEEITTLHDCYLDDGTFGFHITFEFKNLPMAFVYFFFRLYRFRFDTLLEYLEYCLSTWRTCATELKCNPSSSIKKVYLKHTKCKHSQRAEACLSFAFVDKNMFMKKKKIKFNDSVKKKKD